MTNYTDNLVGALALAITDQLDCAVAETAPGGGLAPALVMIAMRDGTSVKRLAERLRLSHPGAVRLVDRLEAAGWVQRAPGHDGRTLRINLTAEGRGAVKQFADHRAVRLRRVTDALTTDERRALEPILEKMLQALTTDLVAAYANCRMCDVAMCEARGCPVEAEAKARFSNPQPEAAVR